MQKRSNVGLLVAMAREAGQQDASILRGEVSFHLVGEIEIFMLLGQEDSFPHSH